MFDQCRVVEGANVNLHISATSSYFYVTLQLNCLQLGSGSQQRLVV